MKFSKLFVAYLVISSLVICKTTYSTTGGKTTIKKSSFRKTIVKKSSYRKTIGVIDSESITSTPFEAFSTVTTTGNRQSVTVVASASNTDAIYVLCLPKGTAAPTQANMVAYGFKISAGAQLIGGSAETSFYQDVWCVAGSGTQAVQFIEKSPANVSSVLMTPYTATATSALQTTGNSSLSTIATNTTGASTSALQTTGNSSLSTIATNTTGAATAANQTNATQKSQGVDGAGNVLGPSLLADFNSLPMSGNSSEGTYTLTGTSASGSVIGPGTSGSMTSINAKGFASVSIQVISLGSGVTGITYSVSGNNSAWVSQPTELSPSSGVQVAAATMSSLTGIYSANLSHPYIEFTTIGAQTSGSTEIIVTLRTTMTSAATQGAISFVSAQPVTSYAIVSGGNGAITAAPYQNAALSNTAISIKAAASSFYSIVVYNPGSTAATVELFNTSTITVGTTTPYWHVTVPPGVTTVVSLPCPLAFSADLYIAAESGYKSGSAPGTALDVTVGYN